MHIIDLDSHNGTQVNGEPLSGARVLDGGDVVMIGAATLVLNASGPNAPTRVLLDDAEVRRRLLEEMARARRYQRALSVAVVGFRCAPEELHAIVARLESLLRPLDLLGCNGSGQLLLIFPELDDEAATEAAQRVAEALAPYRPHLGLATFPDDGCDADTLLSASRSALAGHEGPVVRRARDATTRLAIGERSVIVADPAMTRIYGLIARLAKSQLPVLILGESGSGKENAAYAVHAWSDRADKPFVTLNCAALQETLIESELFGYEKGAFSGAVAAKPGLLERAAGGTVFLDELKELSLSAQAKLLRALEQKRIIRLGDVRERPVDIRLVGATNADLAADVAAGRFRQDLYFRLSGATVILPPLRARPREVPLLVRHFLDAICSQTTRPRLEISPAALERLSAHGWPGNVRELKHAVEYAAALVDGDTLELWHLPESLVDHAPSDAVAKACPPTAAVEPDHPVGTAGVEETPPESRDPAGFRPLADEVRELERRRIAEALRACNGVQRRAAQLIGVPLRTFSVKLKQYGFKDQ